MLVTVAIAMVVGSLAGRTRPSVGIGGGPGAVDTAAGPEEQILVARFCSCWGSFNEGMYLKS